MTSLPDPLRFQSSGLGLVLGIATPLTLLLGIRYYGGKREYKHGHDPDTICRQSARHQSTPRISYFIAETTLTGQIMTRVLRTLCEAKFDIISEFRELGQKSRDLETRCWTRTKKT